MLFIRVFFIFLFIRKCLLSICFVFIFVLGVWNMLEIRVDLGFCFEGLFLSKGDVIE